MSKSPLKKKQRHGQAWMETNAEYNHQVSLMNNLDFLTELDSQSGVYFVSPHPPVRFHDDSDQILVKVGMSMRRLTVSEMSPVERKAYLEKHSAAYVQTRENMDQQRDIAHMDGLASRIDGYLLYWPLGVCVYGVILTKRSNAYTLESLIHSFLKDKGRQCAAVHNHREEWFWLNSTYIPAMIQAFCSHYSTNGTNCFAPTDPYLLSSTRVARARMSVKPMAEDQFDEVDAWLNKRQVPMSTLKADRPVESSSSSGVRPGSRVRKLVLENVDETGDEENENPEERGVHFQTA